MRQRGDSRPSWERSSTRLLRSAYLLCGDRGSAEDLLQLTLIRVCAHWRAAAASPEGSPSASAARMNGPRPAGHRAIYGLAPDGNRIVRVLLPGGGVQSVPVIHNFYAFTVPAGARGFLVKDAAGHTVRLRMVR